VKAPGAHWVVKFNREGLALGLVSPDQPGSFCVAPGGGAGGVGIENSPPLSHFVTFGGRLTEEPKARMESLRQALTLADQPEVVLYAVESK